MPAPGSVAPPGTAGADRRALDEARASVAHARAAGLGIYAAADPLRLYPFELRFLARRKPPERWVIDLGAGDDKILAPQRYYAIVNPEDRLFVPSEYVPLFVEKGWQRSGG